MKDDRMPVHVRTLEENEVSLEMLADATDKRRLNEGVRNARLIAAADALEDELNTIVDDLRFAEWASPEHAEAILIDLIEKRLPSAQEALSIASGSDP